MGYFLRSSKKGKEPDQGPCFSEDMNRVEDQKKVCCSIESNGGSNGMNVNCSKISPQSIDIPHTHSAHEGAETIDCNPGISLAQKKDDIAESDEVLDDDESVEENHKKKKLKLTEVSARTRIDLNTEEEILSESFLDLPRRIENTSFDQPIEPELVTHSRTENQSSEKNTAFENEILGGVVEDNLLEEDSDHCLGNQTSSKNEDIEESNGIKSETNDAEVDLLVSGAMKKDELIRASSDDCKDTPLHHEEQNIASAADFSSEQGNDSEGVDSQFPNGSLIVAPNTDVLSSGVKKLLVLDVNGLLVDISSYVPYHPDPDDIIHKKAVFKRPYCDDFLSFCFERFNVGFWTSRTKKNMDPLLDFLLGSDKHKLLFSWDQSHCTDTGFYTVEKRHKPLLLKKLKKLWERDDPNLHWERGVFNETNTLLLDDTPYKALSNPQYNAIFPYTYRFQDLKDNSLGPGGDLRVYLEGLADAENVQEYVKQNPFGQRFINEKNLSWGYYRKVIERSTTPPRETDGDD